MSKKWEYKVIGLDNALETRHAVEIEERLNKLGEEGWELVHVLDQVDARWGNQPKVECNFIMMKREKIIT
ncbi:MULTISPECIES: DUF4177 domain-containing protein [Clostridium]|uniref:DUF4177 domain-containing protein n=1 Tax=Clostridium TaxID=1485 RepID=UPI001EEE88DF|nr:MULTISPECIES: DUF4177 domain-containing protein [Clostridium]WRY50394.1 DUF4177 domain-containing protein [Clostridium intestinale]